MKKRSFWILAAGLVAIAVGAAAVGVVALLVGSGGSGWGKSRVLSVQLAGAIPDAPPPDFAPFVDRSQPTLRTLVESLDRAAADPDVSGALVRLAPLLDAGWGRVEELRAAVMRFRESGKPIYAHLEYVGNREYYVASACSKIFALPTAILDVTGLATEVLFLRNTLDKVGAEAQFVGIGRYKNAPNQYTETGFTEPHREQMTALVDGFFAQYLDAIAAGRGISREQVRSLVDGGPYDAQEALEVGLVDELLYRDQVESRLDQGTLVPPGRYVRSQGGFDLGGKPRVALVYVVGEILPGASQNGLFGAFAGSDTIARALDEAAGDGSYRAILMRVDSPGGFGPAADAIWRAVEKARERKPVVVSMGDAAASGGYYVAMGSDAIVAQPGTLTGSIGVFSGKFTLRGLYDKLGITKELLTRGRNAGIYSDYRPWSESERERVEALNRAFYEDFVRKAAAGRGMSEEDVDAVAQGRVWSGAAALEHGLVDRLGGFAEAFAVVREKIGVSPGSELEVVVLPRPKGLFETLFESDTEMVGVEGALPADALSALRWARLLDRTGPMARLPFDLNVR